MHIIGDKYLYTCLFSKCNVKVLENGFERKFRATLVHYDDDTLWFEGSNPETYEPVDRASVRYIAMLATEKYGNYKVD